MKKINLKKNKKKKQPRIKKYSFENNFEDNLEIPRATNAINNLEDNISRIHYESTIRVEM